MEFTVMHQNEPVANVVISDEKKDVKIEKLVPDSIKQPFGGDKLDLERIYDFLEDRCYENGRADLKQILKQAHLQENNPWEWVRITHGVTYEDFFWIRFLGECLTWEDVKVR